MNYKLHGDIFMNYKIRNIFRSFKIYRQGTTQVRALTVFIRLADMKWKAFLFRSMRRFLPEEGW